MIIYRSNLSKRIKNKNVLTIETGYSMRIYLDDSGAYVVYDRPEIL